MKNSRLLLRFLESLCVLLALSQLAFPEPPRRIHESLEDGRSFVLSGNTHPLLAVASDQGEVDESFQVSGMTLFFKMSDTQRADLTRLLERQQDRSTPDFHKWLTPEEFADRFGAHPSDVNKVTSWLQSQGLSVDEVARSRTWISFSGTALQVRYALQTAIHRYTLNGTSHYANASNPTLPHGLNGMVDGIRGLNDFHPKPHGVSSRATSTIHPMFTSSISSNHFLAPDDFATIYDVQSLYNSGITGSGEKIVIPGQTDINLADIQAFQTASGLPVNNPQVILDGTDPGTNAGDESEADLDIEWAGAVARQATIIYVNSTDVFKSVTYAIDHNLGQVMSITYGACEAQTSSATVSSLSAQFQQANAQGMTIVVSAGDAGAADCDLAEDPKAAPVTSAKHGLAVDFPSSSLYVTAMGGTEFSEGSGKYWNTTNNSSNGSALSYIPEIAWNDTSAAGWLAATGGGKSTLFAKPSWQQGTNVPNDGARDTPDLALASSPDHDGYLICSGGTCVNGFRNTDSTLNVAGGTSIAAPTFAGIVALIDQQTNASQGNINPTLYALASSSPNAFHDIVQGNNQVPCTQGTTDCPSSGVLGYSAGTGYDQVTGLGSVDAYNLVSEWTSGFQVAIAPTSLSLGLGTSSTATVTVTPSGNFNGTVTFACTVPSSLTNTTCSIPGSVSRSGTVTLTLTNTSTATSGVSLRHFGSGNNGPLAWLLVTLAFGLGIGTFGTIRPQRRAQAAFCGVLLLLLTTAVACDDGSGTSANTVTQTVQPAVTANVTVTATSGVVSHAATISVTVP